MATIRIVDPRTGRPVEFDGTEIGSAGTRDREQARWNELKVWKVPQPGGAPRWMFMKVGMSSLYHRADTPCKTIMGKQSGWPATVDDLPDDAIPCWYCHPDRPEELEQQAEQGILAQIRYEKPRLTLLPFDTPAEVVAAVTTKTDRRRGVSIGMSEPAADLLEQCMADPDFRAGAGDLSAAV